jgi:hypothetical protein
MVHYRAVLSSVALLLVLAGIGARANAVANPARDTVPMVQCGNGMGFVPSHNAFVTAANRCVDAELYYLREVDRAKSDAALCYALLYLAGSDNRYAYILSKGGPQDLSKQTYAQGARILRRILARCVREPAVTKAAKKALVTPLAPL